MNFHFCVFFWDALLPLGLQYANLSLKQRILDMEGQLDYAFVPTMHLLTASFYILNQSITCTRSLSKFRRTLSPIHFNVLLTAVLEEKYRKIPFDT